ncbi:hypothetical protein NSZ01_36330 [Nocardioides szechwanensis]|nr:hypothetical protein NSZ01_36330 [Nocardioides szechwanensis]
MLTSLRAHRAVRDRAELGVLRDVLDWCVLHQTDDEDLASFGDHGIPLAGDGAPWVSEFAVMELGTALGVSTDSAKRYVGAALEIRYRLPRVWERVAAGDLPFWKARFIAERTMALPEAGAAFVDQRVAFVAHKIGYAELQRQIDAAQLRFDPEAAEKSRLQETERRRFDIHKHAVSPAGTVEVNGTLDLPDALDLDQVLTQRAAELRELGCEESLDVRRAMAVGDLARGQATFDYDKPRPLVLHIHGGSTVGRCDNTRTPVLAETIRAWCGNPDATIVVKPVIDLADHIHVNAYEVPDRLAEQDALVDHHCVFPWCTRPATSCDIDHAVPYGEGGSTCSCNTAPLCRGHHRLKTHGGWSYDVLDRGTYLWQSPHGPLFRRDHTATEPVDPPRRRRP